MDCIAAIQMEKQTENSETMSPIRKVLWGLFFIAFATTILTSSFLVYLREARGYVREYIHECGASIAIEDDYCHSCGKLVETGFYIKEKLFAVDAIWYHLTLNIVQNAVEPLIIPVCLRLTTRYMKQQRR